MKCRFSIQDHSVPPTLTPIDPMSHLTSIWPVLTRHVSNWSDMTRLYQTRLHSTWPIFSRIDLLIWSRSRPDDLVLTLMWPVVTHRDLTTYDTPLLDKTWCDLSWPNVPQVARHDPTNLPLTLTCLDLTLTLTWPVLTQCDLTLPDVTWHLTWPGWTQFDPFCPDVTWLAWQQNMTLFKLWPVVNKIEPMWPQLIHCHPICLNSTWSDMTQLYFIQCAPIWPELTLFICPIPWPDLTLCWRIDVTWLYLMWHYVPLTWPPCIGLTLTCCVPTWPDLT